MSVSMTFANNLFKVVGELNFKTVAKLWKDSLPLLAKSPTLNIDLSEVTVANSAGISLLIEWVKYAKSQNKPIKFQSLPRELQSIVTLTGLNDFLVTTT